MLSKSVSEEIVLIFCQQWQCVRVPVLFYHFNIDLIFSEVFANLIFKKTILYFFDYYYGSTIINPFGH